MRPKTLAEVAQLTSRGQSFDLCLANFLDEFYSAPDVAALSETPGTVGADVRRSRSGAGRLSGSNSRASRRDTSFSNPNVGGR